jgi:DNA-binding NarL/FixJ family response regulator
VSPRPSVVIADDHPMVCSGLKAVLEPTHEVVAMVHDGQDVLGTVMRYSPDVVLMDLSMPGRNGLVLARMLKQLGDHPKIVIVTMHADRVYVDEAIRAGADGYLLKTARATELRHGLSEVLAGRQYISPNLRRARVSSTPGAAGFPDGLEEEPNGIAQLTERQREVLLLVGLGLSNSEIASRLGVSAKAIEYHRAGIRRALAISTQAGLYRVATRYAERVEHQRSADG